MTVTCILLCDCLLCECAYIVIQPLGCHITINQLCILAAGQGIMLVILLVHPSVCLSVCLFVIHYQTCKHDILKWTNGLTEPILMQIGTNGLQDSGMKLSTFGVRRSRVKVTRHWNRSQKSILASCHKNYLTYFNQTWQAHITVNARCITTTWMQKVKGQGHTRPQIDS